MPSPASPSTKASDQHSYSEAAKLSAVLVAWQLGETVREWLLDVQHASGQRAGGLLSKRLNRLKYAVRGLVKVGADLTQLEAALTTLAGRLEKSVSAVAAGSLESVLFSRDPNPPTSRLTQTQRDAGEVESQLLGFTPIDELKRVEDELRPCVELLGKIIDDPPPADETAPAPSELPRMALRLGMMAGDTERAVRGDRLAEWLDGSPPTLHLLHEIKEGVDAMKHVFPDPTWDSILAGIQLSGAITVTNGRIDHLATYVPVRATVRHVKTLLRRKFESIPESHRRLRLTAVTLGEADAAVGAARGVTSNWCRLPEGGHLVARRGKPTKANPSGAVLRVWLELVQQFAKHHQPRGARGHYKMKSSPKR